MSVAGAHKERCKRLVTVAVVLGLLQPCLAWADETGPDLGTAKPVAVEGDSPVADGVPPEMYFPASSAATDDSVKPVTPPSEPIGEGVNLWAFLGYVVLLLAGVGLWMVLPRLKRNGVLGHTNRDPIEVGGMRAVGNRQYLMVVRCSGQKMLLGVGPGFVQHLCYLPGDGDEGGGEDLAGGGGEDEPIDLG